MPADTPEAKALELLRHSPLCGAHGSCERAFPDGCPVIYPAPCRVEPSARANGNCRHCGACEGVACRWDHERARKSSIAKVTRGVLGDG